MRKNIIMFSHNTHSFLKNEVSYASEFFERVILVSPYSPQIKEEVDGIPNVEAIFFNKKKIYKNIFLSIPNVFRKNNILELRQSFQKRMLSIQYLKIHFMFLALERIFKKVLKDKLHLTVEESKHWCFYSAWYYGTAYAIVQAKNKYRYAKAISLAHSFEVDQDKSPYTTILFRKKYHDKLDKVSFISHQVFNRYREQIAKKLDLSLKNTNVRYLGTKKLLKGYKQKSKDNIFRIVSCSHVVPVKRLDLIFNALDNFKEKGIIEWTHIGNGKQMGELKNKIQRKKNKNLKVNLIGEMDNKMIHEFYVTNYVDLFINTSAAEGIPVSIMEAIAYGIPVIATDVGGNSEIVKSEFGELISKNPSIIEINSAISNIMSLSESEKTKMEQRAQKYFNDKFNSDNIRRDFFNQLLEE